MALRADISPNKKELQFVDAPPNPARACVVAEIWAALAMESRYLSLGYEKVCEGLRGMGM
jgi:hypothetical protein